MSNIRIEVMSGDYKNLDAFFNVIRYLYIKPIFGGYGFFGNSVKTIETQFLDCVRYSSDNAEKELWHFSISSHVFSDPLETFRLGHEISKIIKDHYQVIFAYDNEHGNPHLHFSINSYSYLPNHPVLSNNIFSEFVKQIHSLLHTFYPDLLIIIDYKEA